MIAKTIDFLTAAQQRPFFIALAGLSNAPSKNEVFLKIKRKLLILLGLSKKSIFS
ncbi:hypothetical protein HMPREF9952_0694 [Haemophilus pittmaniae HK 85]|uniref:Uncharacterized protein n=1 Tax=Haemophilus pittmaniae HK 85 TaxID=1035188 RepID=F9Q9J1_9PAST|nr:hypothetical protein HMPREF9952_0694 [Haemophilus pittmaniae HK 85]